MDIDDSGKISIFAPTKEALEKTAELITYYDQRPEVGKNYQSKVRKLLEIGAIVEILPNVEALVHISQLDTGRVQKVEDIARVGEEMEVKVIEIVGDRVRASRKAVLLERQGQVWEPEPPRKPHAEREGQRGRGRGPRS